MASDSAVLKRLLSTLSFSSAFQLSGVHRQPAEATLGEPLVCVRLQPIVTAAPHVDAKALAQIALGSAGRAVLQIVCNYLTTFSIIQLIVICK